ncbi:MAG TPA: HIT domain-containing protein [Pyrinomonadaceae bacterium]|nr:HIT domain-containing protein [Pyrinomonadaceae bacterium]
MEILWSPWRHEYITSSGPQKSPADCIFCAAHQNPADDKRNLIVHRASHNFVILNRYPYISGHLMIAPYAHVGELRAASKESTDEMMDLVKRCEQALRETYHPEGFNVGMNLGRVAGAGVADHIHMHILPRWGGDTNFMSTVGDTRVLPEDLMMTYEKLHGRI